MALWECYLIDVAGLGVEAATMLQERQLVVLKLASTSKMLGNWCTGSPPSTSSDCIQGSIRLYQVWIGLVSFSSQNEQHPKGSVHTSLCERNYYLVKRYREAQKATPSFHVISCMVFLGLAISALHKAIPPFKR